MKKSLAIIVIPLILNLASGLLFADEPHFTLPVDFVTTEAIPVYVRDLTTEILETLSHSKFRACLLSYDCHHVVEFGSQTLANFRYDLSSRQAFGSLVSAVGSLGTAKTNEDLIAVGARFFTKGDDPAEFVKRMLSGSIKNIYLKSMPRSQRFDAYLTLWDLRHALSESLQRGRWDKPALAQLLALGSSGRNALRDEDCFTIITFLRDAHENQEYQPLFSSPDFVEEALNSQNQQYYSVYIEWWPRKPSH